MPLLLWLKCGLDAYLSTHCASLVFADIAEDIALAKELLWRLSTYLTFHSFRVEKNPKALFKDLKRRYRYKLDTIELKDHTDFGNELQ